MSPTDPTVTIDHAMAPDVINAVLSLGPIRHVCNVCGKRHLIKEWVIAKHKQPTLYKCLDYRLQNSTLDLQQDRDFIAWRDGMIDLKRRINLLYTTNDSIYWNNVLQPSVDANFLVSCCSDLGHVCFDAAMEALGLYLSISPEDIKLFPSTQYPAWFVVAPADTADNTVFIMMLASVLQSLQPYWNGLICCIYDSLCPLVEALMSVFDETSLYKQQLYTCMNDIVSACDRQEAQAKTLRSRLCSMAEVDYARYFIHV